jgi:hypothetical protein
VVRVTVSHERQASVKPPSLRLMRSTCGPGSMWPNRIKRGYVHKIISFSTLPPGTGKVV